MSSQMKKEQVDKMRERKRGFWTNPFVVVIILLLIILIIVSILLIVSSLGIIALKWSSNLTAVFVSIIIPVLGIGVTLAQWLHSLSSHKEEASSTSSRNHSSSVEPDVVSSNVLEQHISDDKVHSISSIQSVHHPIFKNHKEHYVDWGEAQDTRQFYGRERELTELKRWSMEDRCKVIAVLGMGGIGKTSLIAKVVDQIQEDFEYTFWRSVQNAPPLKHILQSCIQFVSDQKQIALPEDVGAQILLLIEYLRNHRCLLILDNCESILQGGNQAGLYRDGYEDYGKLVKYIGETKHQSCLIITSREKPREISLMEGNTSPVRVWQMEGLNLDEGRGLLKDKELVGTEHSWNLLVEHYSGNPLALKLVSQFIREVFNSDISDFLKEGEKFFSDISDVLDQQFERLSALEKDIMYWLAIEREAVSLTDLQENMLLLVTMRDLQEAQRSLLRRDMIVIGNVGVTLQNMVMEYVTDHFVDRICEEIKNEILILIRKHALIKAFAKDYVRDSQIRLILQPLAKKLISDIGEVESERKLKDIVIILRQMQVQVPEYTAGNILNLLIQLGCDLRGMDFSGLKIRQGFLQGVNLQDTNFSQVSFSECVFTETFGIIISVAFSKGNKFFAASGANGEIRLWDATHYTPLVNYRGHSGWVFAIAFSPDGSMLASGAEDQTIRLWDTNNGRCIKIFQFAHKIWSVAFSPDGSMLASAGDDHSIHLRELGTNQLLQEFSTDAKIAQRVQSIAFSPDGSMLASAGDDHSIYLWNLGNNQHPTDQYFKKLVGHEGEVRSVAFNSDGHILASGSDDQTIYLWDPHTGSCLKKLSGHINRVRSVAFNPDGDILASGSDDQTIRFWNVSSGQCLKTLQGHINMVETVSFNNSGDILASGSDDRAVRLWNPHTGSCFKTLYGHKGCVRTVSFNNSGDILASGSDDHTVRLWNPHTGSCFKILHGHTDKVWSVSFSPTEPLLASAGEDKTIRLWNIDENHSSILSNKNIGWIWSISFSPDGNLLATGSDDHIVRLWDIYSRQCVAELPGHSKRVWSVAFNADGMRLASGSEDNHVLIWDISDIRAPQCIANLPGHKSIVKSIVFLSDIQIATCDWNIHLWDIRTSDCLDISSNHTDVVRSLTFNPEEHVLASSSQDGTIKLWNTLTSECLKTLTSERLYENMNITNVRGLNENQKNTLITLGAIENRVK